MAAPQKTVVRNRVGKVFLEITYDPQEGWVYNRWLGLLSVENVKHGADQVLHLLETTGSKLILNDNREIVGSWEGANDWIEQEWMPRALQLGLRKFAHLVSPGIYGKASAEDMQARVGEHFEMRLFEDLEEARMWLQGEVVSRINS